LHAGYKLYILGDLFEVWLGDDMGLIHYADVVELLRQQADRGVEVFIQRGNRDFLLGKDFYQATGATALADETLIEINQQAILLMHGDSLCTDDLDYQAFKQLVRSSAWQTDFLALSPADRINKAQEYRQQSQTMTAAKSDDIMDVNADAVAAAMASHGVKTLIHGHTHRPMVHQADGITRIVLGDWEGHFDYLLWPDNDTWHFLRQPI
jgi:UDP-2,3-diacylglucosamine hydrolase